MSLEGVGPFDEITDVSLLRMRLEEAVGALEAIRAGEVDALVVQGGEESKVYTLKGADETYRTFVEQMKEGAVTLDSNGTILYSNRSFAHMAGLGLDAVMGSAFLDLLPSEHQHVVGEVLASPGIELPRLETCLVCREDELPVVLSLSRLHGEGPAIFAVTLTDLTEQKQHERDLLRANEELQGFCYSISHDLRTPLRSIVGSASIVIEDYEDKVPVGAQRDLHRIKASANHLGQLIDDLLSHARIVTTPIAVRQVDLSDIALKIASELDAEFGRPTDWVIEAGMSAQGDGRFLEMVLRNLLSNSKKYTGGRSNARIEFGHEMQNGEQVFFVRDNGIGFNMAYLKKIFKPFERLHTHDEYPGTGIGLANVQRILARHGGKVWAEAAVGAGATFYFTLPSLVAEHAWPS